MKERRNRSLAFQLTFQVILTLQAVMLIVSGSYYYYAGRTVTEIIIQQLDFLSSGLVNEIETVTRGVEVTVGSQVKILLQTGNDSLDVNNMLKRILERNPMIWGAAAAMVPEGPFGISAPYVYRNGEHLETADLSGDDYRYWEQEWFKESIEKGIGLWSEPYFDEGGGNALMVTYSHPVQIESGTAAVITGDLNLDWLNERIGNIRYYADSHNFILSRRGQVLAYPDTAMVMSADLKSVYGAEAGEFSSIESGNLHTIQNQRTGKDEVLYFRDIPALGWRVCIAVPESVLFEDLEKLRNLILITAVLSLLAVYVLVRILGLRITGPVHVFSRAAAAVGRGDFQVALPEGLRSLELLHMREDLSRMRSAIIRQIDEVTELTKREEKYESELSVAQNIQNSIIPAEFPPFPERHEFDIHARILAAGTMGGDFYDFFFTDRNRICFALGEVGGRGIPAALFMAVTRTLLRSVAQSYTSPGDLLARVSRDLYHENSTGMGVAFFLGILDLETGLVHYSNAGHQEPLLRRADGTSEWIRGKHGESTGTTETESYGTDSFKMEPGSHLFMFSRSFLEAGNGVPGPCSGDELAETVAGISCHSPADLTTAVETSLREFTGSEEFSEDLAMMAVGYYGLESDAGGEMRSSHG